VRTLYKVLVWVMVLALAWMIFLGVLALRVQAWEAVLLVGAIAALWGVVTWHLVGRSGTR
jgi:hypothetical protein